MNNSSTIIFLKGNCALQKKKSMFFIVRIGRF